MSQATDPAPGTRFIDAVRSLEERYGLENVKHEPDGGDVVIHLPIADGAEQRSPHRFTQWQAKYLAVHHIPDEAIRQGKFPSDWPI
jgi:hypothetical protein